MKVLEQHKHNNAGKKKKTNSNKNKNNKNNTDCDNSNMPEQTPELSFTQLEGKCYCCGKAGHRSSQCYKKDQIPQDQWAIQTAILGVVAVFDKNIGKELRMCVFLTLLHCICICGIVAWHRSDELS